MEATTITVSTAGGPEDAASVRGGRGRGGRRSARPLPAGKPRGGRAGATPARLSAVGSPWTGSPLDLPDGIAPSPATSASTPRRFFRRPFAPSSHHVDEGDQGVNATQWLHNEPVLVTVSGDGSVGMWDVTLGQPCVRHIVAHTRCANAVAVAPNDKYLCTGGSDQKVVSCLFVLLVSYVAYVMSYWKRFYIITEVGVHILIGVFHILCKEMIDMLPEIIELFR
ncbi:hypothetical protein Zm00014a_005966 [Zea mays]|uniref:Uncharacterized protein n=1 Tax=Zea mays TaxID=4577 RepID=A0A317Y471_MAIZE|nr:hypothetical protein Zm00014a_005966 [Zea mays]